jgi:hypothetical protein
VPDVRDEYLGEAFRPWHVGLKESKAVGGILLPSWASAPQRVTWPGMLMAVSFQPLLGQGGVAAPAGKG